MTPREEGRGSRGVEASAIDGEAPDRATTRLPRTSVVWVSGLTASVVFGGIQGVRKLTDYDLWWNVATGRVLLATRAIPRVDPLAWTHGKLVYVEAAGDALLALADRAAGYGGLQAVGAIASGLLLGLLAFGRRWKTPWSVACAAATCAAMLSWLVVRPTLLSFTLLTATLSLLEAHRASPATRGGRFALFATVPIVFLWANVHGYAPMGVALVAGYTVYRGLCRMPAPVRRGTVRGALLPPRDGGDLFATCVALGLVACAACCSSMGPALLLGTARGEEDFGGISEWQHTTPSLLIEHEVGVLVLLAILTISIAFGYDRVTGARMPPLYELGLVTVAVLGGIGVVRLLPVGALLVGWVASGRDMDRHTWKPVVRAALALAGLAPTLALLVGNEELGFGVVRGRVPEGAVTWAQASRPHGRMWNFWPFGGYLAYRLFPEQVFMDGRNALARTSDLVRLARASANDPAALEEVVRRFDVTWAVIAASEDTSEGTSFATSARWRMVHLDDVAGVYVRTDGADAPLARDPYRILTHLTPVEAALEIAVRGGAGAAAIAHDGALAAQDDPTSPRAAALDACGAIATGDMARLERATTAIRRLAPGSPAPAVLAAAFQTVRAR